MAYETLTQERRTQAAVRRPMPLDREPGYEAFQMLRVAFVVAPIVAGLDKFFHYLVDWNIYASPMFASVFGGNVSLMMGIVGIVEIVAGLIVAFKPRIGGVIVAIWLAGIILNLFLIPGYFDIALRDFGLLLGALSLSRLSATYSS